MLIETDALHYVIS